jgi:hypothetical protein
MRFFIAPLFLLLCPITSWGQTPTSPDPSNSLIPPVTVPASEPLPELELPDPSQLTNPSPLDSPLLPPISSQESSSGLLNSDFFSILTSNIDINGLQTYYDNNTGLYVAQGNVRIVYDNIELRANRATYNHITGDISAHDNVALWRDGVIYRGEEINYNTNSNLIQGDGIKSSIPMDFGSLIYSIDNFEGSTEQPAKSKGETVYLTTNDISNPNYHIEAASISILPDNQVIMKDARFFLRNTPVFYFPTLTKRVDDSMNYRIAPGASGQWGGFLLTQFGAIHGDHTDARYHVDLRSKRGLGLGADFYSLRHSQHQHNFGSLKFYYIHDLEPNDQTTINRVPVDQDRYRINFQHRIYLPGPNESDTYVDIDINKISDVHFYEDFFFNDARQNPEPDNQISIVNRQPYFTTTLLTRFQLNDFYYSGTRIPELAIDIIRHPLWKTGFYHSGLFSLGFLEEKMPENQEVILSDLISSGSAGSFSSNQQNQIINILGLSPTATFTPSDIVNYTRSLNAILEEPSYSRLYTYQEINYSKTLWGWLHFSPRVGAGLALYNDIDGSSAPLNNFTRTFLHFGFDLSYKATKTWNDVQNKSLGLNGIKHTFEPYINYSYLDASDLPDPFTPIDRLSPTTRPRSLDIPLFTAVDDLRSWNIARVGMRNVIHTRRDYSQFNENTFLVNAPEQEQQTFAWAGLNTYVDLYALDPYFDRSYSNLYNELFFNPLPWLSLRIDAQTQLSSEPGSFSEYNPSITFMPNPNLRFTIGNQYVSNHPFFRDSSLVYTRAYYRFNENWGFSTNHIFEADDAFMEFQSYSITRDLNSCILSIGALSRKNRGGENNLGLILSFTLKDFPKINLPLDIDPNPSGRGGNQ